MKSCELARTIVCRSYSAAAQKKGGRHQTPHHNLCRFSRDGRNGTLRLLSQAGGSHRSRWKATHLDGNDPQSAYDTYEEGNRPSCGRCISPLAPGTLRRDRLYTMPWTERRKGQLPHARRSSPAAQRISPAGTRIRKISRHRPAEIRAAGADNVRSPRTQILQHHHSQGFWVLLLPPGPRWTPVWKLNAGSSDLSTVL